MLLQRAKGLHFAKGRQPSLDGGCWRSKRSQNSVDKAANKGKLIGIAFACDPEQYQGRIETSTTQRLQEYVG